jgi:multiple sugar transport system substrate-binding protein
MLRGQIATVISGCWFGGFPSGSTSAANEASPSRSAAEPWRFVRHTEQSKNKEAAWAFIEYAMARPDTQNTMFVTVDYFPALKTAWENPLYQDSDFYFGGQKTRELWVQVANSPGKIFTTPMDSAAEIAFMAEVAKMLDQGLDPQETIQKSVQAIQDATAQDHEFLLEMLGQ